MSAGPNALICYHRVGGPDASEVAAMMSTGMHTFSVWGLEKFQVSVSEFRSAKIRFYACVKTV